MICTNENNPVIFSLSPGNAGDAPCGRELIKKLGKQKKQRYLLMDKAYEDNNTRFLTQSLNFKPIVPPKSNRKSPWIFDKVLYKSRNNIERLFRKIKRFRRITKKVMEIISERIRKLRKKNQKITQRSRHFSGKNWQNARRKTSKHQQL